MPSSFHIEVQDREFHTILAALRFYQDWLSRGNEHDEEIYGIASNGGEVQPLSEEEIDDLCELINTT